MRRFFVIGTALTALSACAQAAPEMLSVKDAWVRLPAVPGRPAAAYFTVRGGATPDRLVAVESAKAKSIELHEGGMKNGMMTMARIAGVDFPAKGVVKFAPGGNHAMLFGIDPSVKPGGTMPLRFRFLSGSTIDTWAKTAAAGDASAGGHEGH